MKRIFPKLSAALLALALAVPSYATETWAKGARGAFSAVATCTTGTGTEAAPTTSTSAGLSLAGIHGFTVHIETSGTMTAGGKLLAYLFNPETGNWTPVSDGSLDLTVSAVASQSFSGFAVYGGGGRIAYVPSGVGVASHIYIVGS
jgi:hypothetical protein